MTYFRSRRKGRVHVEMPSSSGVLLGDLARQLVELLSDGEAVSGAQSDPLEELVELDSPRQRPTDPALRRLFPDAYADPEGAAEFRRFTETSLRRGKIEAAQVVIETIGEVEVDDEDPAIDFELGPEQVRAWMRCLTDLRLTLAERLELSAPSDEDGEDDEPDEEAWLALPVDDPRGALFRIYVWLGYQLEMLIEAAQ